MTPRPAEGTQTSDALPTLLETERRLSARLEGVAQQADAIVAAAEEQARLRLDQLDAELRAEGDALAQSVETGATNRIEALRREADTTVARYRNVTDEMVLELARHAVAIVVRAGDEDLK